MISEHDLRDKMAAVLANRLSIVEFARWIMSNSWNMQADSSASAVSLASEIHALLAERDDFSLNDSDFLRELHNLYGSAVVSVLVDTDMVTKPRLLSSAHSETKKVIVQSPQTMYVDRQISPSALLSAVLVEV